MRSRNLLWITVQLLITVGETLPTSSTASEASLYAQDTAGNTYNSPKNFPTRQTDFQRPINLPATGNDPKTCNDVFDMKCPGCDGYIILGDDFNKTYTVYCNIRPICGAIDTVALPNNVSQESCLEECNKEPTCVAAIRRGGGCDLCRGSLLKLRASGSDSTDTMFVRG